MPFTWRSWLALAMAMQLFSVASVNAVVSYKRGYALPHIDVCKQMGLDLRLLILVASPLHNAAQRDAIRFSWGHYARSSHVAVAFVLGAPEPVMLKELAVEDAFYGDLIILNSDDSYPIFKMASMLHWTHTYCTLAPRLFTTNDRVFINLLGLLELAEAPENLHTKLTVWGDFVISHFDIRSADVYLFSNDTVGVLLPIAKKVTSKNQVLVSAHEAHNIKRQNVPNFINNLQQSCNVKFNVACRIIFSYQHYDLWQSASNSQNITENVNFIKDISIVLRSSKSKRHMKPVINTGIPIFSLLFLLFCIF